jgi:cytochrome P450
MGEANRLVGLDENDEFYEFYGDIERHIADPEPGSLVARIADAPQTERTRVTHQIPHWMFAMRDTLGANTYRALATIVADADVLERVREEIGDKDLTDPQAIDAMSYLEGCFEEAMRLWPTVPLIARETTTETSLAGEQLDEGTQVMILNTFNHRDPDQVPDADRLDPARWQNGARDDYKFNHLSHGSQYCPGIPLVLLLGKAALAQLLTRYQLALREPDLDSDEPLPKMLDFFEIRFSADPA